MEATAHLRHFRMAPRKLVLVAALVRGKPVGDAIAILKFTHRAAAVPVKKLIESAVANATDLSKGQVDIDKPWMDRLGYHGDAWRSWDWWSATVHPDDLEGNLRAKGL